MIATLPRVWLRVAGFHNPANWLCTVRLSASHIVQRVKSFRQPKLLLELAISKAELIVKDAADIGADDMDSVALRRSA